MSPHDEGFDYIYHALPTWGIPGMWTFFRLIQSIVPNNGYPKIIGTFRPQTMGNGVRYTDREVYAEHRVMRVALSPTLTAGFGVVPSEMQLTGLVIPTALWLQRDDRKPPTHEDYELSELITFHEWTYPHTKDPGFYTGRETIRVMELPLFEEHCRRRDLKIISHPTLMTIDVTDDREWPMVTVKIPIFNRLNAEPIVVLRPLEIVARVWSHDHLQQAVSMHSWPRIYRKEDGTFESENDVDTFLATHTTPLQEV